jgi:hypothetical protein
MQYFILIVIGLWFLLGDPPNTVANTFWEHDAAPWETVDAYYYPDRSNLSIFQKMPGLKSVDDCRAWVRLSAALNNDMGFIRGDFECGIEVVDTFAGISVYRTTVR